MIKGNSTDSAGVELSTSDLSENKVSMFLESVGKGIAVDFSKPATAYIFGPAFASLVDPKHFSKKCFVSDLKETHHSKPYVPHQASHVLQ